jgi:hypothetical protein
VLSWNLTVLLSTSVLGCTFLVAPLAQANWADEIDRNQQDESDPTAVEVPVEPETPKVRGLRFSDRPFNLQLRVGASTTVGELGIVAEYDLLDRVNVGVGFGTNILGLMPGAHLRFRPIVSRNNSGAAVHAVFTELGFLEAVIRAASLMRPAP